MNIKGLTINSRYYSDHELIDLLKEKLNSGNLEDWEKMIYGFILEFLNDGSFIIQKTSGSTGIPKEIKLTGKAMMTSAQNTLEYLGILPGSNVLLCLPVEFIAGKMMIVRAIAGDLNLLLTAPKGIVSVPDKEEVELAAMVPYQVHKLLEKGYRFGNIKKLIIGGTAINDFILRHIENLETEIYESYGMAETCSHIALKRINGKKKEAAFHLMKDIHIETNDSGCLVIHSTYLDNTPIETTDVIHKITEKEFEYVGRLDNVINSGGIKIYPENLEKELRHVTGKECVIIPVPDTLLGQRPVLCIESNEPVDNNLITKTILNIFNKYHLPKGIICYPTLPRNASMKIDRAVLINNMKS